ncbi:MAG: hypothetical protein K9N51_12460, partial [Candidatus Pacebacteria bacterium]|nr:hypothetical protein [Candidatus Paceibacterota bacterium]
MKRFLLFLITGFAALLSAEQALSQVVFSNGIDVSGWFVISNGMVTLESTTNFQGDVDTRGLAPSLGQMYGINPDTGSGIDNGDRLTLRPPILD